MISFKCASRRAACGALFFIVSSSMLVAQASPGDSSLTRLRQLRKQEAAWFLKGRATLSGTSSVAPSSSALNAVRQRSMKQQSPVAPGSPADTYIGTQWTPLGPAPTISAASGADQDYGFVSGRATAIVVDQDDLTGNTVYVGGATSGLWRSTNAMSADVTQVTWQPLIDNQPTLSVGSIAIQPGHTGVILVGTGEPNSSVDSYYGLGILRSTDTGAHWTLISSADAGASPFHGLAFAKIAFSTDNPKSGCGCSGLVQRRSGGGSRVSELCFQARTLLLNRCRSELAPGIGCRFRGERSEQCFGNDRSSITPSSTSSMRPCGSTASTVLAMASTGPDSRISHLPRPTTFRRRTVPRNQLCCQTAVPCIAQK